MIFKNCLEMAVFFNFSHYVRIAMENWFTYILLVFCCIASYLFNVN